MDLPASLPPTRVASPVTSVNENKGEEEKVKKETAVMEVPELDLAAVARRKGLGSLMKNAKDEAKQGAAEFDMSAFGF